MQRFDAKTLTSPDGVTNTVGGPVAFTFVDYFYTSADATAAPEPATSAMILRRKKD